jgi:hypothetical protein
MVFTISYLPHLISDFKLHLPAGRQGFQIERRRIIRIDILFHSRVYYLKSEGEYIEQWQVLIRNEALP